MDVLVVGAGKIASEYVKISLHQNKKVLVITRSKESADRIKAEFSNVEVHYGGLKKVLETEIQLPKYAIVATNIDNLPGSVISLVDAGVKEILVEKPLSLNSEVAKEVINYAQSKNVNLFIAYNRRNYQSVLTAKKMIEEDGGASSFSFDFTEAIFRIDPNKYSSEVLKNWGLANSSHVIDTAFFLTGKPKEMNTIISGSMVEWHPNGSEFAGSGTTNQGVPFSYHANWGAPGRWNIEVNTKNRKYIFSPMEKVKVQNKNSFAVEDLEVDYSLDEKFKPGFFVQVKEFFKERDRNLKSGKDHLSDLWIYKKIFNY